MSKNDAAHYEPGTVGQITLNRPKSRNAMSSELLEAFAERVAEAQRDPELRCLVITGTGTCFSSGADLNGPLQCGEAERLPHERSFAMYEPFLSVLDVEVPVIAALNGHAVGGGFGLALLCDLRIASESTRYGANFAKIGIHPGISISYLLPRLVGVARASQMLFTGELITGAEAARIGLVNEAVASDRVLPRAREVAAVIAANAPLAVRMTKRTLYRGLDWQPRKAAFEEAYAQALTLDTEDAREGISALLEKREPRFRGR